MIKSSDKHVEHIRESDVRRQGIIPSDERSSSILYLLTVSKCIRQLVKKELPGAPGGILAEVVYLSDKSRPSVHFMMNHDMELRVRENNGLVVHLCGASCFESVSVQ